MSIESLQVPSEKTITRAGGEFQLSLSNEQGLKIQEYIRILLQWNDKVNLTAIRDPLEILYRHFCESMFAAVAIPIQSGRLADVGSGGGFPGIPLKIYRPELEVFLVESNAKKATFLAEVTRGLGLTNTRVLVSRYEELGEEVAPLDYICARALGDFDKLLEWSIRRETAAKEVVLWLGAEDANKVRTNASWDWRPPISIPHSLRRLLLVGAPKADVAVGVTTTK